jgi:hypothetical protein
MFLPKVEPYRQIPPSKNRAFNALANGKVYESPETSENTHEESPVYTSIVPSWALRFSMLMDTTRDDLTDLWTIDITVLDADFFYRVLARRLTYIRLYRSQREIYEAGLANGIAEVGANQIADVKAVVAVLERTKEASCNVRKGRTSYTALIK